MPHSYIWLLDFALHVFGALQLLAGGARHESLVSGTVLWQNEVGAQAPMVEDCSAQDRTSGSVFY